MKDIETAKKIAVLIDAENAQCSVLAAVLNEISKHGHIVVKKAYGDWGSSHLRNWKQPLNELAINPVQQFSYTQGKNSSDAAMIIDAMDLLYTKQFDAFALVTSDSDFTKLASRLKESQIFVFGVGEGKTPTAFRNACDDFILTEVLQSPDEIKPEKSAGAKAPAAKTTRKPLSQDRKLVNVLHNAVVEYADADGWAVLSSCGSLIKRQYPDFDPRSYGCRTFTLLFEATGLFEVDRRSNGATKTVYVRDRKK
ncbi:MAG: NYN domain-containing protein [Kiritimatiellaceae bacterium]|nr:NYN domain-containing protein [Kiritimatiellaceae bacterium]